jgi:hypothetical protein
MKLGFERNCGNCDAFLRNKDLQVKPGLAHQGWCRANPPVLIQVMMQQMTPRGMEMAPAFQGVFPPTASDCWCRQWRSSTATFDTTMEPIDAANEPA